MHYSAIDGLRAFLAWTVVAAHITWYTGAAERVHALGVINNLLTTRSPFSSSSAGSS